MFIRFECVFICAGGRLDFLCSVFQYPEIFSVIPQDEPFRHYQITLIPDSITVLKDFGLTGKVLTSASVHVLHRVVGD